MSAMMVLLFYTLLYYTLLYFTILYYTFDTHYLNLGRLEEQRLLATFTTDLDKIQAGRSPMLQGSTIRIVITLGKVSLTNVDAAIVSTAN